MAGNKNNDDFDWDKYDKMTSDRSSLNEPLQRKRRNFTDKRNGSRSVSGTPNMQQRQRTSQPPARKAAARPAPQQPKKRRKTKKKKQLTPAQKKFRKRLIFALLFVFLVMFVIIASVGIGMYAAVSREIKDMNISNLALNSTSFIYYEDSTGSVQQLEQIQSESNRIWVESSEIPQVMKDAIVAIEDERFYKHNGVDLKRTIGATAKYALSKIGIGSSDYGGSTITQQVIKNITNEKEKTSTRKIKEMMRAVALEKQLTKDEILTMYLNIVYFANNCYGVEAASNVYFGKSASELTLAEAASIAGITQYPSEYDPYTHPEKHIEKRNTVLSKMLELGYITESEYQEAVSTELVLNNSYEAQSVEVSSYFVDQVISDVIADLQEEKGYSEDFATQQVYNGGLKIYATVDMDIQTIMEDVYYNVEGFPLTGKNSQSAMVIMDPYTGKVKGLVGGLGEKTDVRGFNRATQSRRQPGSSIKPLSVYGPAIDLGKITEVTEVVDEEITIGNDKWQPKNSYDDFYGSMTVKEAVARSSNIPAVKVLDMVGLSTSYGYLQNKFHLGSLVDSDKNYSSLALGGLTNGVNPEEMAAAYSVFVNSGKYIEPYTYTKVEDASGQIILENTGEATQSISAAAAYITADLLYSVVNSSVGTGRAAKLDSGMPTYGKTGTTDDDCDKWFVGFTPYYVGAVWYGFDTPASISDAGVTGNPCVTAWKTIMERVHENLTVKTLTRPTNVIESTICMSSGMLATTTCDAVTSYFVDGTQPKSLCSQRHASGVPYSGTSSNDGISTNPVSTVTSAPEISTEIEPTQTPSSQSSSTSSGTSGSGTSGSASGDTGGSSYYDTGTYSDTDTDVSGGGYTTDTSDTSDTSDSYTESGGSDTGGDTASESDIDSSE